MPDQRPPLPRWGVIGQAAFFVGVIFTSATALLGVRDTSPAWWFATQLVVSTAEVAGLVAWLTALYLRRRSEG